MAPMAICHHLKMLPSVSLVNEPTLKKKMPVLFTSVENYFASKSAFDNAIDKSAGDEADELFHSKNSCTYQDLRIGEYCFCEAMKVDLAESEDKHQTKSNLSTKNQKHYFKHDVFATLPL